MAEKKVKYTVLLAFILISVILISIEVATHLSSNENPAIKSDDVLLNMSESVDSTNYEGEIRMPVEMME